MTINILGLVQRIDDCCYYRLPLWLCFKHQMLQSIYKHTTCVGAAVDGNDYANTGTVGGANLRAVLSLLGCCKAGSIMQAVTAFAPAGVQQGVQKSLFTKLAFAYTDICVFPKQLGP